MVLRVAARQLGRPAASTALRTTLLQQNTNQIQCRSKWTNSVSGLWNSFRGRRRGDDTPGAELDDPKARQEELARQQRLNANTNLQGNIFQDEIEIPQSDDAESPETAAARPSKTYANTALVVDPDPRSRARWQRKKIIQMVRKNGKLSREERIKMTERELLHKSEFLPTSVKKLVMLARQIAGKPIDEAITQMEWSKKKMAAEMKYYLEEARDLAVAQRGMGLGRAKGELLDKPRKIRTKDGKWLEIDDPTRMYIAQSWVGRGAWLGKELDYKGRGRHGIIKHPSTSFTVILKEEKTRMREYEEREAKAKAKGPWVHLPNRKVHHQRPYYSW